MVELGHFRSDDNELAYSCVIPQGKVKSAGVVFVHAADGNRLGPHRIFVELANKLNFVGYATLRFDLRGCGDSTGVASQGDIRADVFDVVNAVRFFMTSADIDGVILIGISRGAYICYTATMQEHLPLAGMILLSAPISSGKTALKSFGSRLQEYIYKLRDPKNVWKLLSGRANLGQIRQTLITALKLRSRYGRFEGRDCVSRCPVLFIYGGRDPIAPESSRYYAEKCRDNGLPYDCRFIAGANHSFFHYKWTEAIFSTSKQWLEKITDSVSE